MKLFFPNISKKTEPAESGQLQLHECFLSEIVYGLEHIERDTFT